MYFAVVTSMTVEQCQKDLGEDRTTLLGKYRFATEQALSRAGLINTKNLILLKAFVIFLIAARRHDESRFVWTMTGIAIRIAQATGLHRDGTVFNLSPFETEMRRRLWWQVVLLDLRAAEDHGTDPTIGEQFFDTKMPLNINDEDISKDSTEFPPERTGCTEMTFCLIRFEVTRTIRRLSYIPPGNTPCRIVGSSFTIEDKERMIEECHRRIESKYLVHCDMSIPLYWVAATVSRYVFIYIYIYFISKLTWID